MKEKSQGTEGVNISMKRDVLYMQDVHKLFKANAATNVQTTSQRRRVRRFVKHTGPAAIILVNETTLSEM